jgi:hypothetical protein
MEGKEFLTSGQNISFARKMVIGRIIWLQFSATSPHPPPASRINFSTCSDFKSVHVSLCILIWLTLSHLPFGLNIIACTCMFYINCIFEFYNLSGVLCRLSFYSIRTFIVSLIFLWLIITYGPCDQVQAKSQPLVGDHFVRYTAYVTNVIFSWVIIAARRMVSWQKTGRKKIHLTTPAAPNTSSGYTYVFTTLPPQKYANEISPSVLTSKGRQWLDIPRSTSDTLRYEESHSRNLDPLFITSCRHPHVTSIQSDWTAIV